MDIAQTRQLAQDENTAPEILAELATSKDYLTRQYVTSNPNASTKVLFNLGAEFPRELLENPIFNLLIVEDIDFVKKIPIETICSILRQQNVPEFIVEQACDRADLQIQLSLVNNLKISKKTLHKLIKCSSHPEIIEAAKLHINMAGEITGDYKPRLKELLRFKTNPRNRNNIYPQQFDFLAKICFIPPEFIDFFSCNSNYRSITRKVIESTITDSQTLKQIADWEYSQIQESLKIKNPKSSRDLPNYEISSLVGRNINTPVETLVSLSTYDCSYVRKSVAKNPNTPIEILKQLVRDENSEVRFAIANRVDVTLDLLKILAQDKNIRLAEIAVGRIILQYDKKQNFKSYERDNLTILATFEEAGLSQTVLKLLRIVNYRDLHFNLTPNRLKELANKYPGFVARYPKTQSDLLQQLSKHSDIDVRMAVAKHQNTSVDVLRKLACDRNQAVRRSLNSNLNTPLDVLFGKYTGNIIVSYYDLSERTVQSRKIIGHILAEERDNTLEKIIQRLINHGYQTTRVFLAKRLDLPLQFFQQLVRLNKIEAKTRIAIAINPNTPSYILKELVNDEALNDPQLFSRQQKTFILCAIATHQNTPVELLQALANYKDFKVISSNQAVRNRAMSNPKLPEKFIEQILCEELIPAFPQNNPNYFKNNPNSLKIILNHYAQSKMLLVRYIVLLQPEVSEQILKLQALSDSWLDRCAVAQNSNTPFEAMQKLSKDANSIVRAAARANLNL